MDHHPHGHGHESASYQNGFNPADEYNNLLSNGGDNDTFANWGFDAASHIPNQSDPYLAWQSNAGLDNYSPQAFTKSPSSLPPNAYTGYANAHQFTHSSYDPSLVSSSTAGPSQFELGASPYGQPQQMQHGTIAPQALEHERSHSIRPNQTADAQPYARPSTTDAANYPRAVPQAPPVNQTALYSAIPGGNRTGDFLLVDPDQLGQSTSSVQFNPFVHVGQGEYEWPVNRATLAPVIRRKSRNELRKIAGNDARLQAKLGKKHVKKMHSSVGGVRTSNQPSQSVKQEHSGSDTDSSDYTSDEESDEEDEVSPLPAQRPDDPREGVKYDTIKALWEKHRFSVPADRIRNGMVEFNDVVQTIKNRWKADSTALSDAMVRKKNGELPLLKSRVNDQLEMLKIALKTAVEHGHRDILGQLGQHAQFMASLASFLIDRIKQTDYNGPLTRLVLEMLTHCDTLTEKTYVGTKLQKCVLNLAKNGSAEINEICTRIKDNVADATSKQSSSVHQPAPKSPPSNRPTPEPVVGVKRSAPGSASSDQASKRVLVTPGAGTSVSNGTAKPSLLKRTLPIGTNSKPSPTAVKPAAGAGAKTKATVTKPVTSAATGAGVKKAVTKTATPSLVAAAIKSIEKKAAPPAPPKPAFSFAETMANLNKSKEKEPTPHKSEDKQPPETPAEKAKRLRKEERRKLRVTFKPDHQLVEIKIFHHDVEEELGHDASMIRDVGDVGGEGRMFKQHKDMMDIDEDDDATSEENLGEYSPLTLTDFSSVDAEERKRNYKPYAGGELEPESSERIKREHYEASTLMVFYTHPSDIPPCPREPAEPYNGDEMVTKPFGTPDAQEPLATRLAKFAGPVQPVQNQPSAAAPNISAILAMINPQGQATPQPPQSIPTPPSAPVPSQNPDQMAEIQRILASIPQAPVPQPPQIHQPPQSQQSQQSTMPPNLAGIFASLNPQGQDANAFNAAAQPPPVMDPNPANLAALFTQFNQGQNGGPGANFNPFVFPSAAFNMPNGGQFSSQQQQNQQPPFENEERRRWREGGGGGDYNDQVRRGKPGKKGGGFPDKRFTVPCKYFKSGKCQKGEHCTYRHEY